jgi:carbamoyltransferase
MKILGIQDSHDSGIALVDDGKIVFAINEERLSRIKLSVGFPRKSIDMMTNRYGIKPEEVDKIAIGSKYIGFVPFIKNPDEVMNSGVESFNKKAISFLSSLGGAFFKTKYWIPVHETIFKVLFRNRKKKIKKILREYGFKCPIEFVDHHTSHAASAYFTSDKEDALVLTADAAGDALSATVSIGKNRNLKRIEKVSSYNSLGKWYSYVTELCGYKACRHEGKITGLAAYGQPKYLEFFRKNIYHKNGEFINSSNSKHERSKRLILKELGKSWKKEDLAASIQTHLEEECVKFVNYWLKKTKLRNVVLAGGVFANVRLNQEILKLKNVDYIYIHPNMGDGGLALGAAIFLSKIKNKIENAYFGPEYSEEEIEKALKKFKSKYKRYNNVEERIAQLINEGRVVARFNGKMEYGPRALGNRSILYHTKDKNVNEWLNKRLNRTEFMPFAPVTLEEEKEKYYLDSKGGEHASKFMTITFDCSEKMKKQSPAVVHIDGTARPQLINKKTNPSYYKILEEYYKLSNIPTLVNTSFNMHEEPIVCSPEDAIRSFNQGNLDNLAIGNFIVENSSEKTKEQSKERLNN